MAVFRFIGWLISLLLLTVVVLGILVIDLRPAVQADASQQISDADTVKKLLQQVRVSIEERHESHVIVVSQQQVQSLIGFVQRATPHIHGDVQISDDDGRVAASIALPSNLGTAYLNLAVRILPADKLVVDYVQIGSLTLPGNWAVYLAKTALNIYTDSHIGSQAVHQVAGVAMHNQQVAVKIRPMHSFLEQLNLIRAGLDTQDPDALTQHTAYYLRYIAGRDIALKKRPQPFHRYLNLIMARAREQSTPDNAVLHNKAAVLALAIFLGHHRIANLVGDVQPDTEHALKPAAPALLRGRNDLARHFIISAALQMLSEQNVSVAVGEFKELMDRAMGGSGYSFVDLTADLAGVELGRVLGDPTTALEAQDMLARAADEALYMPTIDGLTEGLSKQEFVQRFDKVDSQAYLDEVARIRQRLAALPLYQLSP